MKLYFQIPNMVGIGMLFEHTKKKFTSEEEARNEFIHDFVKTYLINSGDCFRKDCCTITKKLRKKAKFCLECGMEIGEENKTENFRQQIEEILEGIEDEHEFLELSINEDLWNATNYFKGNLIVPVYGGNYKLSILDTLIEITENKKYKTFIPFITQLRELRKEAFSNKENIVKKNKKSDNDDEEEHEECDCDECN